MVHKRPSGPRLRSGAAGLRAVLVSDTSSDDEVPPQVSTNPSAGTVHSSKGTAGVAKADNLMERAQAGKPFSSRAGSHSIVTHFSAWFSSALTDPVGKGKTPAGGRPMVSSSTATMPDPGRDRRLPLRGPSSAPGLTQDGVVDGSSSERWAGPYSARPGVVVGVAERPRGSKTNTSSSRPKLEDLDEEELESTPPVARAPTLPTSAPPNSERDLDDNLALEEQSLNSSGSIQCRDPRLAPLCSRDTLASAVADSQSTDISLEPTEFIPTLGLSEVHLLRSCFERADADNSGYLDVKQFGVLCNLLLKESANSSGDVCDTSTVNVTDDSFDFHTIEFVFRVLDTSRTGRLTLRDYVSGSAILCHANLRQRLLYVFRFADMENRESLTEANLMVLINAAFTVAVAPPGHKWGLPTSHGTEGKWPRSFHASGILSLDHNPDTLRERARRHMGPDGRLSLAAFKAWAWEEPAFRAWLMRLGSRGDTAVRRVRVARERQEFVSQMAELGFSEEQLAFSRFDDAPPASVLDSSTTDALPAAAAASGEQDTMGGPLRPSRSRTFGGGGSSAESRATSVSAGPSVSPRQSSFDIDFSSLVLERRIGEGTFAEVWAGRWLEAPVAIKVFKQRSSAVAMYQLCKGQQTPVVDGVVLLDQSLSKGASSDLLAQAGKHNAQAGGSSPWDPQVSLPGNGGSGSAHTQKASQQSDTSDQSASFLREVELLSSLRHPNVLLYMGACVKATAPLCIVSEHVVGGSLFDNLHGSAARAKVINCAADRLLISLDVARGMLYLHSLTPVLLHRDLKSSNILVDHSPGRAGSQSRVKAVLCDFGLSRLDNSPTQAGGAANETSLVGTLITMAPEILRQERYTSAADVFSFGVVLWELWTGRIPHHGVQPVVLLFQVAVQGARPPIEPGTMPPAVAALIRQCWAAETGARPSILQVVRQLQDIGRKMGMSV